LVVPPPRGQIMRTLIPPRRARKAKDWLDRAKLVVAAARKRAIEKTARQRPADKKSCGAAGACKNDKLTKIRN
jgi:hypothetical protein